MDGSLAIEDNRAALKRIVAQLVEMAGMAEPPTSPPSASSGRGGRREAAGGGRDGGDAQDGQDDLIATAPPDPLTASLRSALLPLIGGEERRVSSTPPTPHPLKRDEEARPSSQFPTPLSLKGGEEGRASSQPPAPLPRRSGERWSAKPIGEGVDRTPATRRPGAHRPPRPERAEGGEAGTPAKVIPRFLWLTILRLLRPAEAAARRLIIAAARGLVVPPPRLRKPVPQPATDAAERRRLGLAVMFVPGAVPPRRAQAAASAAARGAKADGGGAGAGTEAGTAEPAAPRIPAFRLFDPPYRLALFGHRRRRTCPPHAAPRIMFPGLVEPHRLPPPPGPHDLVGATRVIARIAALAAALDDLPAQAKRFARWKARADAARRQPDAHDTKPRRRTPIRRGRLPGGRLWRFDPPATHPAKIREVDRILAHAHALAVYALDYPDTS